MDEKEDIRYSTRYSQITLNNPPTTSTHNNLSANGITSDDDDEVLLDPLEVIQDRDINQSWIVHELNKGDKIEIYDEEMGWWETGTIHDMNKHSETISFQFDKNLLAVWPNDGVATGSTMSGSVEDFEHARLGTFTIQSLKPLLLPRNIYIPRDQIISLSDVNGVEWLFIGSKQMDIEEDEDEDEDIDIDTSSQSCLWPYNCNKDRFERISDANDIYNVEGNGEKLYYHNLHRNGMINKLVKKLLGMDKAEVIDDDENIGIQTVIVPTTKTVHLLCQNQNTDKSCHAMFPLYEQNQNKNRRISVPGYRTFGGKVGSDLNRSHGKLIYVDSFNSLMYFGGVDMETGNYSTDIWYLDLKENEKTAKWRLYDLSLPLPYDTDLNVVIHGDLVFVFFPTNSRNIYIYDLWNKKIWQSSKRFPGPYHGKAMTIKRNNPWVHFLNGSNDEDEINMDRPYHFKLRLDELIPSPLWKIHAARYQKLAQLYLYHHLHEYNQYLSVQLVSTVMKYFPVFG